MPEGPIAEVAQEQAPARSLTMVAPDKGVFFQEGIGETNLFVVPIPEKTDEDNGLVKEAVPRPPETVAEVLDITDSLIKDSLADPSGNYHFNLLIACRDAVRAAEGGAIKAEIPVSPDPKAEPDPDADYRRDLIRAEDWVWGSHMRRSTLHVYSSFVDNLQLQLAHIDLRLDRDKRLKAQKALDPELSRQRDEIVSKLKANRELKDKAAADLDNFLEQKPQGHILSRSGLIEY